MKSFNTMLSAWAVAAGLCLGVAAVQAAPGEGAKGKVKLTNNAYIVQLAEMPVSAYDGSIKGYKATQPRKGQKIDPDSPDVVSYMAYLAARHDQLLNGAGGGRKLYSYGYVFNGFAADLTPKQAEQLAASKGVLAVSKDEFRELVTATTPGFLGLTAPGGLYDQLGGVGNAGENVIIGIVDSGVWPEHPSYSDRTGSNGNGTQDGKLSYQQIPGWHGKCQPGEAFNASNCNQKLIGARYYNEGFGGNAGIDATLPFEFNSPRDHNGHGTHTSTTAGGNANVKVTDPLTSPFGAINGIAPRARIAAYKACWSVPGTAGSCSGVDLLAAIDQAVADGVDVINYSISGTRTNFRDPVEIAFLFAADAGVFVAASAGNSGPTSSTVAHPSPWITTVAAGTHPRSGVGSVTLGSGATLSGASFATKLGPKPFVRSRDSGVAGADTTTLARCYGEEDDGTARLDAAKVAGKIVLCERGGNVLVNKVAAVKAAGGVGMVLVNVPGGATTQLALVYDLPAVHLAVADYATVDTYAAAAGATATINAATIVNNLPAPSTASFSSRGPLLAGAGDILKPDVIAPGQDILAGVAPPNNGGRLFDLYSGTSMSSPHVAGLAALLRAKYPSWSPMAIKSALMTSAYDVIDTGSDATRIFRQGAGHVRPNSAADPGLVYDSSFGNWLAFICGAQPGGGCTGVTPIDPSDLNLASIAVGSLAGTQTVKRKVTNVSGSPLMVAASISGVAGVEVTVTPSSLTIPARGSASFTVGFRTTSAALNAYTGGYLTWTGGGYSVRSPIVVRPVALAAPASVTAAPGGASYDVTFGYAGDFTAAPRGLVPAAVTAGTVNQDPDQNFDPNDTVGNTLVQVDVPAGTTYARFSLFDGDVAPGSDIDLYVYGPTGAFVGGSGNGGSDEEVSVVNPAAGTYYVFMHGWGLPTGTSPFKLHTWSLGSTSAGNMTVTAPPTAAIGATGTIGLSFSGLDAGTRYLGSVVYGGAAGLPSPTIVRVDTP